jgi:hypothetical protein
LAGEDGVKFNKGVVTMTQRRTRSHGKRTLVFIFMGVALFLGMQTISSGLGYAGDRVKPEMVLPKGYPDGFNAYGHINRIGDKRVVIDDDPFFLAQDVTYNIPTRLDASKAYFGEGAFVGVLTNAKGEAKSLWLLE